MSIILLAYFASIGFSPQDQGYGMGTVNDGAGVEMKGNAGTRGEGGHYVMMDGKGVSIFMEEVLM
jgi:hypothetical protein